MAAKLEASDPLDPPSQRTKRNPDVAPTSGPTYSSTLTTESSRGSDEQRLRHGEPSEALRDPLRLPA
jgi:hypothetical protein